MKIRPIDRPSRSEADKADFEKVEIIAGTPHCKEHGAMNKLNGVWRCIGKYRGSTLKSHLPFIENTCRAGCEED